jgi:hypothetical protein
MAAVERDDDRWQLALDGMKELSGQYRELLKLVQVGFGSLGNEVDTLRQQLARLEADGALRAKMQLWLLVATAINGIGWIIVATLLLYGIMRLFSVVA